MDAALESPVVHKPYLSHRPPEQQRPSTLEVIFGIGAEGRFSGSYNQEESTAHFANENEDDASKNSHKILQH